MPILKFGSVYHISNMGRIKSIERTIRGRVYPTIIIKQRKDKDGYMRVNISYNGSKNDCRVHRLVGEAFIPNPENKSCINHKNGIVDDNVVKNLEWATHLENTIHAINNSLTRKRGGVEKTLTEKQVMTIFNSSEKTSILSKKYGVCLVTVDSIRNGKSWGWLTGKKYVSKDGGRKYIEVKGKCVTYSQLAQMIGTTPPTITYRLKQGWSIDRILSIKPKKKGVVRWIDSNKKERIYI